jgi:MFS family permease
MDLVVLGWIALQITGSPFMVGLGVFVRSAPMIALGPFAGVVADRLHRGRVLLFTQSLGVATALALSLLFATGHGSYWPLVGLEMLLVAPEERRGGAMGILSACIGTQPLGTLWVGFLATGIGVAPAIALNSLLAFLIIVPVALPLARRGPRRETAAA